MTSASHQPKKKIFLTFADSRLYRSKQRIVLEAEKLDFYNSIIAWDESNLEQKFMTQFSSQLRSNIRGFGYWVWKPQVILQALDQCDDGDIVQYADVGFTINPDGISRLSEYFERAERAKSGIVAFQGRRPERPMVDDGRELPTWPDKLWTKGDLFDYFGVREHLEITETPSVQAGLIFVRKCPESVAFLREWLSVFEKDIHLVDDSPSISPNFPGFREHRHDQSVFSILSKIHGVDTYSSNEFWYPKALSSGGDWEALHFSPFHATRSLDFGLFGNSKRKIKYFYVAFKPKNLWNSIKILKSRMGKLSAMKKQTEIQQEGLD